MIETISTKLATTITKHTQKATMTPTKKATIATTRRTTKAKSVKVIVEAAEKIINK